MCAVVLPEVRFTNEAKRGPIDTSRIPMQRYKLVIARAHTHRARRGAKIPQVLEDQRSLTNVVFIVLINNVR